MLDFTSADHKHVDTRTHCHIYSTLKRHITLACICFTQSNSLYESTIHNPHIKCINQKILYILLAHCVFLTSCLLKHPTKMTNCIVEAAISLTLPLIHLCLRSVESNTISPGLPTRSKINIRAQAWHPASREAGKRWFFSPWKHAARMPQIGKYGENATN